MPGDDYKRATSGRRVRAPGRAWNAMMGAADQVKGGAHDVRADLSQPWPSSTIVYVRNNTGADQPRLAVLAVGGPIVAPAANLDEFQKRPTIAAIGATFDAAGYPLQSPVVLIDAIPSGSIGRGVIAGVTVASVIVFQATVPPPPLFADFTPASGFTLVPDGGTEVLWMDTPVEFEHSGTYAANAIIRLAPTQRRTFALIDFNYSEFTDVRGTAYGGYEVEWVTFVGWAHKPGGRLFGKDGDFPNALVEINGNADVPVPIVAEVMPAGRLSSLSDSGFQWVFFWPGLAPMSGSGRPGSGFGLGGGGLGGGPITRLSLGTATGSGTVTLAGVTVAAGALLVVNDGTSGRDVSAVTFAGVSMTRAIAASGGAAIWYLYVPTTTTGSVVALGPDPFAFAAVEVLNLALDVPDQGRTANGLATAPDVGPTGLTAAAAEYAQAVACMASVGSGGAWSNGFASGQSVAFASGGVTYTLSEGYAVLSAVGTPEAKYTGSATQPATWTAVMETFR